MSCRRIAFMLAIGVVIFAIGVIASEKISSSTNLSFPYGSREKLVTEVYGALSSKTEDTNEECDCGKNSYWCKIKSGKKTCECRWSYIQVNETCISECLFWITDTCKNGGKCYGRVCQCKPGTYGDRCEMVRGCENTSALRTKCGYLDNVECAFNQTSGSSFCQCKKQDQIYDDYNKECKECDCGKSSDGCSFQNGQKICSCKSGYLQFKGTCRSDCFLRQANPCENGGKCKDRVCQCLFRTYGDRCEVVQGCENTSAVRTRCGNSDNIKCVFNQTSESTFCQCKEQDQIYDSYNQKCEECDCGKNSYGCSFKFGQRICSCKSGYLQYNGTCKSECFLWQVNPCENGGKCENRVCQCLSGTYGDRCEIVNGCENTWAVRTKCGHSDNVKCAFNRTSGTSFCHCDDRYHAYDTYYKRCRECDCGEMSNGCSFHNGQKNCSCKLRYLQSNGTCKSECFVWQANPCENGGLCINNLCECLSGTHGDRCEIVNGCENTSAVLTKCGHSDNVKCGYNTISRTSFCFCDEPNHAYDDYYEECRKCNCGEQGTCSFFLGEKRCECEKGFKAAHRQGSYECFAECFVWQGNPCENGGQCIKNLCDCYSGTHGHWCEIVNDCENTSAVRTKCGHSDNVKCGYNTTSRTSFCFCDEPNHAYDEYSKECRKCNCGERGTCSFFVGEKRCDCEKGFEAVHRQGSYECFDIDECKERNECPYRDTSDCINTQGSYYCQCKAGYYPIQKCPSGNVQNCPNIRWIEQHGCEEDLTSWRIGYIALFPFFAIIYFGMVIAIFKPRKSTAASNSASRISEEIEM